MRTFRAYALLVAIISIPAIQISCQKSGLNKNDDVNLKAYPHFTQFTIPKGEHYASPELFRTFSKNIMQFEVIFDSSCQYTNVERSNANDINKLYGFSDCGTHHHENSARFGWRWNGNSIDLFAYCYVKGKRSFAFIDTISLMERASLSISAQDDKYLFTYRQTQLYMDRNPLKKSVEGYLLYPYFGGDEVAPREMKIYLKDTEN